MSAALDHGPRSGPNAERTRKARLRHPRVVLVGVVALLLLAASLGGAVGGWTLANRTLVANQANPQPTVLRVPTYVGLSSVSMPDVRGLSLDEAMQVLGDAGVPANVVSSSSRPSAGAKGTVIAQTPTFGAASPTKVDLVVSAGGSMPNVVGEQLTTAATTLDGFGIRIEQVGGYDPDKEVGSVLATTPKAGASLASAARVTVNEAPSARYLSTLSSIDGGCSSSSDLEMNGTTYTQGLTCSAGTTESPDDTSWLLEKKVDAVEGTIGVPDVEEPGTTARVRIVSDGHILLDRTVRYGATVPVKLRVTGSLRLTIRVTAADGVSAEVGLGDLELSGSSAAMSALPSS